ncbi:hypothetical protein IAU60_001531 [Kwoniella sp. DSM 27419]
MLGGPMTSDRPEAQGRTISERSSDGQAGDSSARKVRRRAGPFKRSRTGCGTCKRRGKKCDEDWNNEGFCQRCVIGQFECSGRTAGPSNSQNGPRRGSTQDRESSSDNTTVAPEHPVASSTGLPTVTSSSMPSLLFQNNPATQTHQPVLATPLDTSFTSQSSNWSETPATTASALPSEASSIPFNFGGSQPLYDWPGQFATASHPSAFLNAGVDGSLAIDSSPHAWNNQSAHNIWNDLLQSLATGDQEDTSNLHHLNGNSRVLFINSDKPTRQGVSLAEIYARVVESWLVGIPSTTRDHARARILALNDNNSVMRNVRYAVSAAYIFLYAGCSTDPDHPTAERPKLAELAYKGAGLGDEGGTPLSNKSDKAKEPENQSSAEEADNASKKLRKYADYVSTPFAADTESTKWTQDAIRELREVIVTDRSQLSDLLWGVIDLQLVEFIRGGAAPSYSMLALGDRLVRAAFGSHHPSITLSALRTSGTLSLRFYALSDISRCIVQRGRRTIFNFWSDVGEEPTPSINQIDDDDEPWATYLGLPDAIVVLLAEIVNLCAELNSGTVSTVSIKDQADELESALKAWSSQSFSTMHSVDSTALISRTIAGELWRLAALVLLYQSVHRVGGLHPVLLAARDQILSLLDSITRLPSGDLWGFIALPAFLAACLSISANDRKRSMQHMLRPGPERLWLDNVALVEKVWEEVDETGRLPDWHEKMTREGLSIAFF